MSDEININPEEYDPENDPNALSEGDIFIDALEYEGDVYLALAEPEEDDAVFFLKIEQDENGNDVYSAPDESLEDILYNRFCELRAGEDEEQ